MKNTRSRRGSAPLAEKLFEEKDLWHRRRARMSFARKLEVLDRMRERLLELPFRPESTSREP